MGRVCWDLQRTLGLATHAKYNARTLAALCRLSPRQLQRQFQRHLGITPQRWLDEQRLALAGPLLVSGESVKKVAFDLGFKQSSHFCRKFKAWRKLTPSEFVQGYMNSTVLSPADNKCRCPITDAR
jgi:AraC-like DNA-binding protein